MWLYRSCTLEITLLLHNVNRTELDCETTSGGRVKRARHLSLPEAFRLRRLALSADLYGSDHIGNDLTPTDGLFETLRFRPVAGGRAVVLVTSGNDSFVDNTARSDLLEMLQRIHAGLLENIPQGYR
jgi:hypothetical protein